MDKNSEGRKPIGQYATFSNAGPLVQVLFASLIVKCQNKHTSRSTLIYLLFGFLISNVYKSNTWQDGKMARWKMEKSGRWKNPPMKSI